jgi:hypothetical protein
MELQRAVVAPVKTIALLFLAGCSHYTADSPRPTYKATQIVTEDGRPAWSVTCGRIPNCYAGVSEKCSNGYDIYQKIGGVYHRGLMVTCK